MMESGAGKRRTERKIQELGKEELPVAAHQLITLYREPRLRD
jgi:hypothetical protein